MSLHKQLYDFVEPDARKLDLPIIFAYQNAPRIEKPYASLRIDTIRSSQHDIYSLVDDLGFQKSFSWRVATVELQTFGIDAGSKARTLSQLFQTETSSQRAQRLNCAVGNRLFLSEVPELLNMSQFEERGIYQFEFMFTDDITDDVGLIENVDIEGKLEGSILTEQECKIHIGIITDWDDHETIWDDNETRWGT